jgi:hypothetical protein
VLSFLDRAGGIDVDRGSYLNIEVLRAGQPRAVINLYQFLLEGKLERLQFHDGDTVVVRPRRCRHRSGRGAEPLSVRAGSPQCAGLGTADTGPAQAHGDAPEHRAQHRVELKSEYHPLGQLDGVMVHNGDLVTFTADKYPTTLLVRIGGAQVGERALVMPTGPG